MNNDVQPRPRGRPRQFDAEKAKTAAMRLFWERGYAGTSIQDLSEALAINPPSLYAAFGDKRQLFTAAIDTYQSTCGAFAAEILAAPLPTRAAIEKLLLEAARIFTDKRLPKGCMVVTSALNCAEEDRDVATLLADRRKQSEHMLATRIAEGIAAGDVNKTVDAKALARYVATVFQGLSIQARDGASRRDLEAVVAQAMISWPKG
jgi:TetR/AcrR family transcriptional regulator, copper-responsive repressor